MADYYLGVDLGGTKILTALADRTGRILARRKLPTEVKEGRERVIANILTSIAAVLEEKELTGEDIIRIGIGAPGPLSVSRGIVYNAPNLDWEDVAIIELIEGETGIPALLENDANAAALGEKWFGAGRGAADLLYVTVSTGIGGGIVIDRKIYHGASDGAGEVGHIVLHPEGPRCNCGNRGCLEALASGTAIARMGREAVDNGEETIMTELSRRENLEIDAGLVARAARQGDPVAAGIWERAGFYLGLGLGNLLNIFNPERLILGGGVMKAGELIWEPMMESLREVSFTNFLEAVEICRAELGDDVGVQGAIAVAMGDDLLAQEDAAS